MFWSLIGTLPVVLVAREEGDRWRGEGARLEEQGVQCREKTRVAPLGATRKEEPERLSSSCRKASGGSIRSDHQGSSMTEFPDLHHQDGPDCEPPSSLNTIRVLPRNP